MLNEYPGSLLPEKTRAMLNSHDIDKINELDDKITKWYIAKWISLFLTAFSLTLAFFLDSNFLLLATFVTLLTYFVFKYNERYQEEELLEYLIELQIHLALDKGMNKNGSKEEK